MDIYLICISVICIAVLMGGMTRGAKRGFGKELAGLLAIVASGIVVIVVTSLIREFLRAHVSGIISSLIILALLGLFYKIFDMFFSAFSLITGLPLVRWLDAGLGLVLGLVESFLILCAFQYILEFYLLI